MKKALLTIFICAIFSTLQAQITVSDLRCESIVNPLGIAVTQPQFSWTLTSEMNNVQQGGYELLISDNEHLIKQDKGNCWETKVNSSDQTLNVAYAGTPLKPFTRYYWKVRVCDATGNLSDWSPIAWFETAMFAEKDWKANWIGDGKPQFEMDEDFYREDPMPLFRKTFRVDKNISSARLYISGIGYYEAWFNGKRVGENVLEPGWTNYSKQVLYSTYDITDLIKKGINTSGIMLGNGWYNPLPLRLFGRFNLRDHQQTGRPVVKAQLLLRYTDGTSATIGTDESWLTAEGPVVHNNIYLGERYDARREVRGWNQNNTDDYLWRPATIAEGPDGIMTPQMQPPVKIQEVIKPVDLWQTKEGTYIVDMGVNFAGVARIRVKGLKGTIVSVRYGENIHPDSTLNWLTTVAGQLKSAWGMSGGPGSPKDAFQEDSYVLKGGGREEYTPRFTFHGFRYVELKNWPGKPTVQDIEGVRMYADLETDGTFSCSNQMFNKLHEVTKRTFLSNVFSVQSDCPGREKMGYGGDMVATGESFIYNFNMHNFYRKAIQDFINDQRPEGGMTEIAPHTGIADRGLGDDSGPLGWQLAFAYLQKQLYEFYGDTRIIEQAYPAFVRQVEFLRSKAVSGYYYWDIGDHGALDTKDDTFSANAFFYEHLRLISSFANILGKEDDYKKYSELADRFHQSISKKFLIPGTGRFGNGTQGAQLFALYYGLSPEEDLSFNVLLDEYARHNWHVSTGIFACKMGFDVLREKNRNEIAYQLVNQRDYPGWGYMIECGATTLWESWRYPDNSPSQNHPMFGSTEEWFYRSLLGINPGKPGFEEVVIKPQPAGDLRWARGSYQSVRGKIVSDWEITENTYKLSVEIPANTKGTVYVRSKESAQVNADPIATFIKNEEGYSVYEIPSGRYTFTSLVE